MTINEFRNKHYGRGGSTHHLHHLQLMGVKQDRGMSKSYSFVRDGSDVTGQFTNANESYALAA